MNKKRVRIVLFVLLFATLAAAAAFLVWQSGNIGAAYTALTSDPQAIRQEWSEHRKAQQEFLDDHEVTVTPPTAEQNEALLNRRVTPEAVKEALGLTEPTAPPQQAPVAESSPVAAPSPPTAQELIDECTRSLYSYRIDLMARLGELKADALRQWEELPAEAHDYEHKSDIILSGIYKCVTLERELDERVTALLDTYRKELTAIGADPTVMDALWTFYCEDKRTTKAYYFEQYL